MWWFDSCSVLSQTARLDVMQFDMEGVSLSRFASETLQPVWVGVSVNQYDLTYDQF